MEVTRTLLSELAIRTADDVLGATQEARRQARALRFSNADAERVGLIATELVTNQVRHAGGGCLEVWHVEDGGRSGLALVARDVGPGIRDVREAVSAGFSTAGSFGDGLATVKELADTFDIKTELGRGTCIEATKWS